MTHLILLLLSLSVLTSDAGDRQAGITLTEISELKRYTDAHIRGKVVRILDEDEFRLEDASGRIKVYTGWRNTKLVSVGEVVTVRGHLDPGVIREFYASEIIREDGTVVTPTRGDSP